MIQAALIGLIISSIVAQLPHTYFIFVSASKLSNKKAKMIQASAFCLIASLAIFIFIWIGEMWLAAFAAFVETVFNLYYYTDDFWRNGMKKKASGEKKSVLKMWRERWIYFFIAILIPIFMYIFGYLLKNLDQFV